MTNKRQEGQMLIEVVVALGLMVLLAVSLVVLATYSIRNVRFGRNQSVATKYAQQLIEDARQLRDTQPDEFFKEDGSCPIEPPQPVGIFARERICQLSDDYKTMTVNVNVTWTDGLGNHQSQIETTLTNWF